MSQLNKVVKEEMVFINQEFKEKETIIDFFANEAFDLHLITNREDFKEAIFNRENEVSTSIGFEIAMPHGKSSTVVDPFIGFMRLGNEIRWSSQNEDLVSMIFIIGVPSENQNKLHLKFISELSKKLLNDKFREDLKIVNRRKDAFSLLNDVNIGIETN